METFLRNCKPFIASLGETADPVQIVMGNEAGDLDSIVSALTYAYYLSEVQKSKRTVPVINIPKTNLCSNSVRNLVLSERNISADILIYREDIDLHALHDENRLQLVMVDHNTLPEVDYSLNGAVVEVIDHHQHDRPREIDGFPVTIEPVGSCCTLVAEKLFNSEEFEVDQVTGSLLYATILLDTVCLSDIANRKTEKDVHVVESLERLLGNVDRQALFATMRKAQFDISGLTISEILSNDLKIITSAGLRVACSTVKISLQELLASNNAGFELSSFCSRQNVTAVVLLGIIACERTQTHAVQRQVAVYSKEVDTQRQIVSLLTDSKDPDLELELISPADNTITVYEQHNVEHSRKKILPMIKAGLGRRDAPPPSGDLVVVDQIEASSPVDVSNMASLSMAETKPADPPGALLTFEENQPTDVNNGSIDKSEDDIDLLSGFSADNTDTPTQCAQFSSSPFDPPLADETSPSSSRLDPFSIDPQEVSEQSPVDDFDPLKPVQPMTGFVPFGPIHPQNVGSVEGFQPSADKDMAATKAEIDIMDNFVDFGLDQPQMDFQGDETEDNDSGNPTPMPLVPQNSFSDVGKYIRSQAGIQTLKNPEARAAAFGDDEPAAEADKCPFTPQNSLIEGDIVQIVDRGLPSFYNSEMVNRIQEKKKQLEEAIAENEEYGNEDDECEEIPTAVAEEEEKYMFTPHSSFQDLIMDEAAKQHGLDMTGVDEDNFTKEVLRKRSSLGLLSLEEEDGAVVVRLDRQELLNSEPTAMVWPDSEVFEEETPTSLSGNVRAFTIARDIKSSGLDDVEESFVMIDDSDVVSIPGDEEFADRIPAAEKGLQERSGTGPLKDTEKYVQGIINSALDIFEQENDSPAEPGENHPHAVVGEDEGRKHVQDHHLNTEHTISKGDTGGCAVSLPNPEDIILEPDYLKEVDILHGIMGLTATQSGFQTGAQESVAESDSYNRQVDEHVRTNTLAGTTDASLEDDRDKNYSSAINEFSDEIAIELTSEVIREISEHSVEDSFNRLGDSGLPRNAPREKVEDELHGSFDYKRSDVEQGAANEGDVEDQSKTTSVWTQESTEDSDRELKGVIEGLMGEDEGVRKYDLQEITANGDDATLPMEPVEIQTEYDVKEAGKREHAPVHDEREHAPVHDEREHAPAHDEREHAPAHDERERAPLHDEREHAPVHDEREHAPAHDEREHAPVHDERGDEPQSVDSDVTPESLPSQAMSNESTPSYEIDPLSSDQSETGKHPEENQFNSDVVGKHNEVAFGGNYAEKGQCVLIEEPHPSRANVLDNTTKGSVFDTHRDGGDDTRDDNEVVGNGKSTVPESSARLPGEERVETLESEALDTTSGERVAEEEIVLTGVIDPVEATPNEVGHPILNKNSVEAVLDKGSTAESEPGPPVITVYNIKERQEPSNNVNASEINSYPDPSSTPVHVVAAVDADTELDDSEHDVGEHTVLADDKKEVFYTTAGRISINMSIDDSEAERDRISNASILSALSSNTIQEEHLDSEEANVSTLSPSDDGKTDENLVKETAALKKKMSQITDMSNLSEDSPLRKEMERAKKVLERADQVIEDTNKNIDEVLESHNIDSEQLNQLAEEPNDPALVKPRSALKRSRSSNGSRTSTASSVKSDQWQDDDYPAIVQEDADDDKPERPSTLTSTPDSSPRKRIPVDMDMAAGEGLSSRSESENDLLSDLDEKTPDIDTPNMSETSTLQELEWEGDPVEPIPEYSAKEEIEDERYWRTVTISDKKYKIDMKVIEPYKKVLSHGGYYGDGLNAIILFSACFLPNKSRRDYQYVMDNLFLYLVSTLELLVADDYAIVFFHGATPRSRMPSLGWLKRCYQMVDRRLRKNLKGLFLVHPTLWIRTVLFMSKPFISSKFSSKIRYVPRIADLAKYLPMEYIYVPDEVKSIDDSLSKKTGAKKK